MSDAPDPTRGPDASGAPPGGPGPPPASAGVPPSGDPAGDARQRWDEARNRMFTAREQARQARAEVREAAREARRQAWDARRDIRGVVGVRIPGATGASVTPRIVFGLIFVLLGVMWTLDNFGLIESGRVVSWWPILLMVYGAMKLVGAGAHRNPIWGGIWLTIGAFMLIDNLGFLHFSVGQLWPLALVVLGVLFIRRSATGPVLLAGRIGRRSGGPGGEPLGGREGVHVAVGEVRIQDDGQDRFEMFSFWSHVDRRVTSQTLRKAEVIAVMGGIRLDLRGAKPAPEGAVLDLSVVWGGIDIVVPPGWQIVNEATVMLGGITDSTVPGSTASGDRLVLRGAIVMGGVELKSA